MILISITLGTLIFSQHGQIQIYNIGVLLVFPFTVLTYYQYVKNDNKRYFEFVLLAVCIIHLNLRGYALGTRAWQMLPWAYVGYTITSYTIGHTKALIGLISNIIVISLCLYYRRDFMEDIPLLIGIIINLVIPAFVMGIIIYFKNAVEERRNKESIIYQRREIASKMIYTLSSEINDPLTIAKLSLKRFRRSSNPEFIKKCTHSIDRVTAILKKVRRIKNYNEVEKNYNKELINSLSKKKGTAKAPSNILKM